MASEAASLLSGPLKRCLAERNISSLNAIQERAIPPIWQGYDALLIAPTAGGKTEAALLPLLERITKSGEGARLLYVAPLRALLNDIHPRIEKYAGALGLRTFKWHGDVSATKKRKAEQVPPDVLLITPESIEVILVGRRSPDKIFGNLQAVLIDEVHYFAGSARGAHLLSLLGRLERIAGVSVQRVGLSATVGNPQTVLDWISREPGTGQLIVTGPEQSGQKEKIWEVVATPPGEIPTALLPRMVRSRLPGSKVTKIAPRTIVFCRSRAATEDVSEQLEREARRHPGVDLKHRVHHSSVAKDWREKAEKEIHLRDTKSRAVVATSTLELGIDLGDLDLVGQVGEMSQVASFLQRVGRAGRRPHKPQWFVSINVKPRDEDGNDSRPAWSFLKNLAILNLGARAVVEDVTPVKKAFHVFAQQLLAIAVARHGLQREHDLEPLLSTAAFADVTDDEANEIVKHMLAEDYLRSVPPHLVVGAAAEKRYLQRNALPLFSVFDTPPEFVVLDGANEVGTVDAGYVIGLETPFKLRLAGKNWDAFEVSVARAIVKVRPARAGKPPSWWSTGPGTSRIVVEEMARILDGASLANHIELDEVSGGWVQSLRGSYRLPLHEPGVVVVTALGAARCRVGALGGDRVMMTFAKWLHAWDNDLETRRLDATSFVVSRSSEATLPLPPAEVTGFLDELRSVDESRALELLAGVHGDFPAYNKFAPCVPPRLRQLHLAAATTDVRAARSFIAEVDDSE